MISYKKNLFVISMHLLLFLKFCITQFFADFLRCLPWFSFFHKHSHELQHLFPSSFPSKHNTCMSYHTSCKSCLRMHNHTPALRKAYMYPEMGMEWSRRTPYQSMPKQRKCSLHNTIIYYYLLSVILSMLWRSHTIKERKEKIEILLDIYE